MGLPVTLRIGGESLVKFFAELFYKKAGFGYFYKSNITNINFLIVFLKKIPNGNFPFLMRIVFTLRNFYL